MAVNRYTQVQWDQPMSSYVKPPLEMLQAVGATMQGRHEKALDDTYKLNDLMASVNTIDQHKPFKKELDAKYQPRIEDITNKIVSGDNLTAQRDLNKLKREWQNDPLRLELEKSHSEYGLYQKDKIAKGEKYAAWEDPTLGFKGSNDQGIAGFRFTGMGEVQDHQKRATEMMKDIAEDAKDYSNVHLGSDGIIRGSKGGHEYVLSDKVQQLAKNKVGNFIETTEGRGLIKQLKYENPNATFPELVQEATNYLYNAGSNQIFSKTESGNTIDVTGLATMREKAAKDTEAANRTTSSQSEALLNSNLETIGEDMKFDSKGNLQIPTKMSRQVIGTNMKNPSGQNALYNEGKDLDKMVEQVRLIDGIKRDNPALANMTHKEVIETYNKARKSVHAESIPLESISNVAAKNIGQALVRNKEQRNFYLYDSKGKTEDGTLKTVLNKLSIPEEDFDKALANGIGGYTQAGPSAGSYYVEVKDSKGTNRRVMISPDAEMQKIFRTSQAINEARKSMVPTKLQPIPELPNYSIEVKPEIKANGEVNWNYIEVLQQPDGKVITSPTTLDEIRKAENEHLKKSNYLATDLTVLKDNTTQ